MERVATDTVVLIHGLWMTPLAWEHWVKRYEQRGLKVITPGYPGVEQGVAGVEALRRDPSPLADLGVRDIFDHLANIVSKLDRSRSSSATRSAAHSFSFSWMLVSARREYPSMVLR